MKSSLMQLLAEDERLQAEISGRISPSDKLRIALELRSIGCQILKEGLSRQYGADTECINREFRARTLGRELAAKVEAELARRGQHG